MNKKKKAYDVAANRNGLLLKIGNQLKKAVEDQLATAVKECDENLQKIKETFEGNDLKFFDDYAATVHARLEIAKALQSQEASGTVDLRNMIAKQKGEKRLSVDDIDELKTLRDAVQFVEDQARAAETEDGVKQARAASEGDRCNFQACGCCCESCGCRPQACWGAEGEEGRSRCREEAQAGRSKAKEGPQGVSEEDEAGQRCGWPFAWTMGHWANDREVVPASGCL